MLIYDRELGVYSYLLVSGKYQCYREWYSCQTWLTEKVKHDLTNH